jgi:UDP-2,4-diacetamido-2,4,6-trideoxy-beta-L-altropyranose hydrolase
MGNIGGTPSVVFRVDASTSIGTGHVMRCLALANELDERGVASHFVCRSHQGHMAEKIRGLGHEVVLLPHRGAVAEVTEYASWLGAEWEVDADETIRLLAAIQPLWLIADHYAVDVNWERRVRNATSVKLMVIDGLANREHDCDLLLDQTFSPGGETRWDGLVPDACQLLVGPQHALLRPEFAAASENRQKRNVRVKRIFVAFGGVDQPNATSIVLDAIVGLGRPDMAVDVVVGWGNPHRDQLVEDYQMTSDIQIHVDPPDVAALMAIADLAVSAGGTMLLEQCYLHLPSIVVSIANNQIKSAQALHDIGAVYYLGDVGAVDQGTVRQAVSDLMADASRFEQMQRVSEKLMARPEMSVSEILLSSAHETL